MAIEVTFCVRGKATKQALFIEEDAWELSLSEVRTIIQKQDLYVPLEYKFLTLNENAIACPCEETLLLKNITRNHPEKKDNGIIHLGLKVEEETEETKCPLPEIWVAPLKVIFSTSNAGTEGNAQEPEQTNEPGDSGEDETGGGAQFSACPYKMFTQCIGKKPCPSTLLKILFGVTLILFAVLASLTLTMHLTVKAFTSLNPSVSDIFSKLNLDRKSGDLEVKLSQLEMAHKYEVDQLSTRMAELEDLYLKDLAIHKRELNLLKKQMAGHEAAHGENTEFFEIPDEESEEKADEDKYSKYKAKPKGKGKGGERTRG